MNQSTTSSLAAARAPGPASSASAPARPWRAAAVFAAVTAIVFGAVAALNARLDPLTYDGAQQAAMAAAMDDGHDVAIADPNIDWRALRSRAFARMTRTPDVILFGGSRWQEATADVAPGKRFYNAFVTNDFFDDIVALTGGLYRTHHLPRTLILSVRFFSFGYLDRHDPVWWTTFSPEYRDLSQRLGVPAHSWDDSVAVGKYSHLLSAGAAWDRLARGGLGDPAWEITGQQHLAHRHVVGADGALRFSQDHLDALTPQAVEQDALQSAADDRARRIHIDRPLLGQLASLLRFLKSQGVQVVLVQTPFHPAYFRAIQGSPYLSDVQAIERDTRQVAEENGALTAGGLDSAALGCAATDYRDFNHASDRCLAKVLRGIPGLQ
jgi:hypothetical protein